MDYARSSAFAAPFAGSVRRRLTNSSEQPETVRNSFPQSPPHEGEVQLPPARELQDLVLRALEDLGGTAERQELMQHALDLGAFTAAQRAVPAPPTKRKRYPSQLDYRLSWALHHLHKDNTVERVQAGVWRVRQRKYRPERLALIEAFGFTRIAGGHYTMRVEGTDVLIRKTRAGWVAKSQGPEGLQFTSAAYPTRADATLEAIVTCQSNSEEQPQS